MKRGKKIYIGTLLVVVLCAFSAAEAVQAQTLRIGGTGFGLGVMQILAETFEKYHPAEKIDVIPSLGSSGGINALLRGALDIAISGRPLNGAESGQGINGTVFARSPFIFIVNKNVAKEGLALQELEKIFRGETLTWDDGTRIRLVLRPETDTVTQMVRGLSSGMDQAVTLAMSRDGMIQASTDQESAEIVEQTPGALAAGTLTQIYSEKRQVGILSFNGIEPSVRAISDGSYPLSIPIYLVTPVKTEEISQKFLAFIDSEDGRTMLTENGNMVVRNAKRGKQ